MVGHVTHAACMYLVGVTKTPRHGLPLHTMPCHAMPRHAKQCGYFLIMQSENYSTNYLSRRLVLHPHHSLSPLPFVAQNEVQEQGKIGEP